jgi:hypothetical protein
VKCRHERPGSCGYHNLVTRRTPVPADPSSPIPAALAQLTHAEPLQDADPPRLLVPRQATFALLTILPRRRSWVLRFRQAM